MELNSDNYYEYEKIDSLYVLSKAYNKIIGSGTREDGEAIKLNEIDSTDLPKKELGEYNNFQIIHIDDKQIDLVCNNYSVEDNYKAKENWRFNCQITKGSLAAFNRGETIVAVSKDDNEYNIAEQAYLKAVMIKDYGRVDPYQSSVKYNVSDHIFLISKRKIVETSNAIFTGSIKLLK
jgi:hypothetical protein